MFSGKSKLEQENTKLSRALTAARAEIKIYSKVFDDGGFPCKGCGASMPGIYHYQIRMHCERCAGSALARVCNDVGEAGE